MRILLTALVTCAVVVAACVQLAFMSLYGDLAQPPALARVIPPALGAVLLRPLASGGAPASWRAAYARAILHRGDIAGARAIVGTLAPSADRSELAGAIAERSGAPTAAARAYLEARDVEHAQALVDALERAGRLDAATALEADLAAHSTGAVDEENHARVLWRLGQFTEMQALRLPPAAARQKARESLRLYDEALALAPSDETFLLAAGQQALTLGDHIAAAGYYQRALDAVPNSADARRGLERARLP
jgi:tetratricopeptide (TPR) repeat protein